MLPKNRPTARARRALFSTIHNKTTAPTSTAIPTAAAMNRAGVMPPSRASSATAKTGIPSLTKLFQIPVTMADRVIAAMVKPHEVSMAKVRPTPIAPPAGRVLDTAVDA